MFVCVCVCVCFAGIATSVSWLNISSLWFILRVARVLCSALITAPSHTGGILFQNWTWMHYCRRETQFINVLDTYSNLGSWNCSWYVD